MTEELNLASYYAEVVKTAGLTEKTAAAEETTSETEVEMSDEKAEAISAVADQFNTDEIAFDSEDEKIAAALMIVEGYEEAVEKQAGIRETATKGLNKVKEMAMKAKEHAKKGADKAKDLAKAHPKSAMGAAAGAGAVAGGLAAYKMKKNKK